MTTFHSQDVHARGVPSQGSNSAAYALLVKAPPRSLWCVEFKFFSQQISLDSCITDTLTSPRTHTSYENHAAAAKVLSQTSARLSQSVRFAVAAAAAAAVALRIPRARLQIETRPPIGSLCRAAVRCHRSRSRWVTKILMHHSSALRRTQSTITTSRRRGSSMDSSHQRRVKGAGSACALTLPLRTILLYVSRRGIVILSPLSWPCPAARRVYVKSTLC